jgi:hypothetical protein
MVLFKRRKSNDFRNEEWQEAFHNIKVRAELESLSNLVFVDSLRIFNSVKGRRHIQLIGRRGTGKTSLLLKLYTEYLAKFKHDILVRRKCEYLPIWIDIDKLSSISIYDQEESELNNFQDPATRAANNFRRIMQMILQGHKEEIDGLQKYVNEYPIGPFTRQRAKRKLRELRKYLEEGENRIRSVERELSKSWAGNVGLQARASAIAKSHSVNPLTADISSSIDMGKEFRNEWAEKVFATAQLSLSEVSNRLIDVVKSLRCKQMLLLIDEWSAGQNPVESQPFLLELMKTLFFSSSAISVKMAVVPENYQEYDDSSHRGLEPHSGYFMPINLDSLQPYGKNLSKAKQVMREIVSAHLRSQIRQADLPHHIKIIDILFKDEKLFLEAIVASEGNIRDFLLIIVRSYEHFLKENELKQNSFSFGNVKSGISEHFQHDKWRLVKDERLRSIFIKLCSTITCREIRVADVPGQDPGIGNTLNNLRLKRLLHASRESCIVEGQLYRFFIVDASGYQHIRTENPRLFSSTKLPREPMLDAGPENAEVIDPFMFYIDSN